MDAIPGARLNHGEDGHMASAMQGTGFSLTPGGAHQATYRGQEALANICHGVQVTIIMGGY